MRTVAHILIFSVLCFKNLHAGEKQITLNPKPTKIMLFAQEISIEDSSMARQMAARIRRSWQSANLVAGLHFKYGEYLFCLNEPQSPQGPGGFKCSVYFDFNGEGQLSSYESDPDYGKGDLIESLFTKSLESIAAVSFGNDAIHIDVTGEAAQFILKKMPLAWFDESDTTKIRIQGEHVTCLGKPQSKPTEMTCRLTIPVDPLPTLNDGSSLD